MPTPKKGPRLGGSPAHQRLILSNLATALFEHGRITTTEAKARVLRPLAEKLITKAKKAELGTTASIAARREVLKTVRDKSVVHVLFTEIGPKFADRPGGYTRITKIAPRKGDNAPMAVIELVLESYSPKQATVKEAEAATKRAAKDDAAKDEAVAEESTTEEATAADDATEEAPASYEGAVRTDEASTDAPDDEHQIKGNEDSMKYHVPGSQWYDATQAEVWFATAEDAEAAGFEPAGGADAQQVSEED